MNKIILVSSSKKKIHVYKFYSPFPFSATIIQRNAIFNSHFPETIWQTETYLQRSGAEQVFSASAEPAR